MRVGHRLTNLFENAEETTSIVVGFPTLRKQLGKSLPLDEFHAEKRALICKLTKLIDRGDAWMLQLTTNLSFLHKTANHVRLVLLGVQQHFDRQVTTQIRVASFDELEDAFDSLGLDPQHLIELLPEPYGREELEDQIGAPRIELQ